MSFSTNAAVPGFVAAFVAIIWAVETIQNLDVFPLCLLSLFAVLATYENAFKASCGPSSSSSSSSSSSPPLPLPTNLVGADPPDEAIRSRYLDLLRNLAPALEAIESCIGQLQGSVAQLGKSTGDGCTALMHMYRHLHEQSAQVAKDLRELEEVVWHAGHDGIKRGLQTLATSVGQLGDRADGVYATIEGQAREIAALRGNVCSNELLIKNNNQLADSFLAGLSEVRAQLADMTPTSSLAALEERLSKLVSECSTRLGALTNVTTSTKTQQNERVEKLQVDFDAKLEAVKTQISDSATRHENAMRDNKRAFYKALVEQSNVLTNQRKTLTDQARVLTNNANLFRAKSDKMDQETTRLHGDVESLRSQLDASKVQHKLDMDKLRDEFKAATKRLAMFLTDKLKMENEPLHNEVKSLRQQLEESQARHEQAFADYKTASEKDWKKQVEGLTVMIQEQSEAHKKEMKSILEDIGPNVEHQVRYDDASTQASGALDLRPMAEACDDDGTSEEGDSTSETPTVTSASMKKNRRGGRRRGTRGGAGRKRNNPVGDASSSATSHAKIAQGAAQSAATVDSAPLDGPVPVQPTTTQRSSSSPAPSTAPSTTDHELPAAAAAAAATELSSRPAPPGPGTTAPPAHDEPTDSALSSSVDDEPRAHKPHDTEGQPDGESDSCVPAGGAEHARSVDADKLEAAFALTELRSSRPAPPGPAPPSADQVEATAASTLSSTVDDEPRAHEPHVAGESSGGSSSFVPASGTRQDGAAGAGNPPAAAAAAAATESSSRPAPPGPGAPVAHQVEAAEDPAPRPTADGDDDEDEEEPRAHEPREAEESSDKPDEPPAPTRPAAAASQGLTLSRWATSTTADGDDDEDEEEPRAHEPREAEESSDKPDEPPAPAAADGNDHGASAGASADAGRHELTLSRWAPLPQEALAAPPSQARPKKKNRRKEKRNKNRT